MSRRKGKALERAVAKDMTEWLGFQVSPTPASGAYGTREGWDSLSGDLMFKGEFPFYVECKNRETFKLEDLFSGKGEVQGWLNTTWSEARKHGKRPLLICKRNHMEPFFFVDRFDTVNSELCEWNQMWIGNIVGYPLRYLFFLNPKTL